MAEFISFPVALEGSVPRRMTEKRVEEALQKGWTHLRYDHPAIGAKVEYDLNEKKCKKIYETFSGTFSMENWLEDTFRVVPDTVSGLE